MRKLAIALAIAAIFTAGTTPADAQYHNRNHGGGGYHNRGGGGGGWVAPLLGGMLLGGAIYGLSRPSYADPYPRYRTECQIVPVYDQLGYFRGERRECFQVPNY